METEETGPTAGEGTAGSAQPPEGEKLLPPGNPLQKSGAQPVSPPVLTLPPWVEAALKENKTGVPRDLRAADLLHGGNAVALVQNQKQEIGQTAPNDADEIPLDRNLREVGLKEALPHPGLAPEKVDASETGADAENGLPKIRTYAADMGQEMKKRGSTLSTIIGAEKAQAAKIESAPKAEPRRRGILVIGAIFFIIVGISAVVTIFFLRNAAPSATPLAASVIPVNHRVSIELNAKKLLSETLAEEKNRAALNLGEIEAVDITKNGVPLIAEETLLALGAPDELARNATGVFVGIHAFNHSQPLIIVSVSAYDFAFHGMLAWERTIGESLGNFFAPGAAAAPPTLAFTDQVSANIDVRKSQNEWPILYAFPRQNLLVITTNESTLREVLTRLSLQNSSNQ